MTATLPLNQGQQASADGCFNFPFSEKKELIISAPVRPTETGRIAVISTAHITREDAQLLDDLVDREAAPITMAKYREGYFISLVPACTEHREERWFAKMFKALQLSDSFVDLWCGLRRAGFAVVQLDADAGALDDLKTNNW